MIELFIESQPADISEVFSTVLTFAIDDIKDFGAKNTAYSKTVILPGTKRNNKLLGHVFKINRSTQYDPTLPNYGYNFNAAVSARAMLFADNIQVFKGVLRLMKVRIDNGVPDYEIFINGELGGLISKIGAANLEDLDFSAYDHFYNITNIHASWSNPGGSGYCYPSMDYGNYSVNKHDWQVLGFRPALYVKEYIDKIFAAAGYSYDCALFNTSRFKGLVNSYNKKQLFNKSTTALTVVGTGNIVWTTSGNISFNAHPISGGFTGSVSDTLWTYAGATINGTIAFATTVNSSNATGPQFKLSARLNGVEVAFVLAPPTTTPIRIAIPVTGIIINAGDVLTVYVDDPIPGSYRTLDIGSSVLTVTNTSAQPVQVNYGEYLKLNGSIPSNVKQIDYLSSIIKLFHLYVYDDKDQPNVMRIAPYVDFYTGSATVDWSNKIDRSKPMEITPLSELGARYYEFRFRPDSDFYGELYRKRYNEGYGDFIYDSGFEFMKDKSELELMFSATVLVGYFGEDKVYSTIMKRTGTTTIVEESVDSNIRILQTKKVSGVTSWDVLNGATVLGSYTDYLYAGHYDDPDAPANDIQFGAPKELFFALLTGAINVAQFNVYWSSYMAEITDPDSKMLRATLRLTRKDINNLDFSNFIWIDGGKFRLNKIDEYNATREETCTGEFLKVINEIY